MPHRILKNPHSELLTHPIPPQPALLARLNAEMESEYPDPLRVEQIISSDPGMASAILRLSNSPAFYRRGSIGTIREAIRIVGLRGVSGMATALTARKALDNGSDAFQMYWSEAQLCADLAATISLHPYFRGLSSARVYVFGLLHDIGAAALAVTTPGYADLFEGCKGDEAKLLVREREELNVSHAMMGFFLAERWGFPHTLARAIREHHSPNYMLSPDAPGDFPRESLLKMCAVKLADLALDNERPERREFWVTVIAKCMGRTDAEIWELFSGIKPS